MPRPSLPFPMRSKLFVPGSRPELFDKAWRSGADAISIDLEDAVAPARRPQARLDVRAFVDARAAAGEVGSAPRIVVRVNAFGSDDFDADVRALACTGVALINLPKVEAPDDVTRAAAALDAAERANGAAAPIPLLLTIETPAALRGAAALAAAHPRVVALQLGLGDLFEPHGIARDDLANVHAAMFALRLAAAEAGVAACDGAFAGIDDEAGFRAEALMAQRLGFVGKSCIHPRQIALAHAVFAADAATLAQARRIVEAARAAAADGRAAFAIDGRMVDPPFLARAQAIVAAADAVAGTGGPR